MTGETDEFGYRDFRQLDDAGLEWAAEDSKDDRKRAAARAERRRRDRAQQQRLADRTFWVAALAAFAAGASAVAAIVNAEGA